MGDPAVPKVHDEIVQPSLADRGNGDSHDLEIGYKAALTDKLDSGLKDLLLMASALVLAAQH